MKRGEEEERQGRFGTLCNFVVTGWNRKQIFNAVQEEEEPEARCRTYMSKTLKQAVEPWVTSTLTIYTLLLCEGWL